jgi:hypothetical protein
MQRHTADLAPAPPSVAPPSVGPQPAGALLAVALLLLCAACGPRPEALEFVWAVPPKVPASEGIQFEVPAPPFSDGIFPCSDCHDPGVANRTRREMTMMHSEIAFEHDSEHRWCLDCHSVEDRDMLHLASGELVSFEQSYRLCGQCHGDKYRDWRAGVHGRRTGRWDGDKQYLLCVHCHDAHAPHFPPIEPMPAPKPPRRTP